MMTEANENGISEVFQTMDLPEGDVPIEIIDRWNVVCAASPFQVLTITGKENLAIGSVYNEETDEFTMDPGMPQEACKPIDQVVYVFLIENKVLGMYPSITRGNVTDMKLKSAFSSKIIVKGLEDNSPIDLGYTWDGTTFTPPTNI